MFAPMDDVNRPNREEPPNADTPMVEGTVQPRKPSTNTRGSFFSQSSSNALRV
jgi:hypothetical protein